MSSSGTYQQRRKNNDNTGYNMNNYYNPNMYNQAQQQGSQQIYSTQTMQTQQQQQPTQTVFINDNNLYGNNGYQTNTNNVLNNIMSVTPRNQNTQSNGYYDINVQQNNPAIYQQHTPPHGQQYLTPNNDKNMVFSFQQNDPKQNIDDILTQQTPEPQTPEPQTFTDYNSVTGMSQNANEVCNYIIIYVY